MTDTGEPGSTPEPGTVSELADLLAASKPVVQEILTAPAKEVIEKERVVALDAALKTLMGNADLKDFIGAYQIRTNTGEEATLLSWSPEDNPHVALPSLTMGPDGTVTVIFNPSDTSRDRVYPRARLMDATIVDNGKIKIGQGDQAIEISTQTPYATELVSGGMAVVKDGPGGTPYLLADDIAKSPIFAKVTAESMNNNITSEVKRMSHRLLSTPPTQTEAAMPHPVIPPAQNAAPRHGN